MFKSRCLLLLKTGLNAAIETAQSALKTAQKARKKIEASKAEALQGLREKGQDLAATERSFDTQLQDAKQKEAKAQAALDGLVKARDQVNAPALQLSPELKRSVHSAVANRYRRIGAVMVLGQAYVLLFLMLLAFKFLLGRSQRALQTLAAAKDKDKEAQASDMRRQMTEARLQTLQAQVKPHYLIVVPLVAAFALIQGTARATTAANARPASPGYAGGCTAQTPAGAAALDQG